METSCDISFISVCMKSEELISLSLIALITSINSPLEYSILAIKLADKLVCALGSLDSG